MSVSRSPTAASSSPPLSTDTFPAIGSRQLTGASAASETIPRERYDDVPDVEPKVGKCVPLPEPLGGSGMGRLICAVAVCVGFWSQAAAAEEPKPGFLAR